MGPGFDDHGWVFDLVHVDPERRADALARQRELLRQSAQGQIWINQVWSQSGSPGPRDPTAAEEMGRARQAQALPRSQTLYGPLDAFLAERAPVGPAAYDELGRFVLLFLLWERRYPDQWREAGSWAWSPWGTKERLLATLSAGPIPPSFHPALADLVAAAVVGPYRCKDWLYAAVARPIDGPDLRARLGEAKIAGPDRAATLRARFVLEMIERPGRRITRRTWKSWPDRGLSGPG